MYIANFLLQWYFGTLPVNKQQTGNYPVHLCTAGLSIWFRPYILYIFIYMCIIMWLAMKWNQNYSSTLFWLHTRLTFSLLRSAIQCIRGSRSHSGHAAKAPASLELACSELKCSFWLFLLTLLIYLFLLWPPLHCSELFICVVEKKNNNNYVTKQQLFCTLPAINRRKKLRSEPF